MNSVLPGLSIVVPVFNEPDWIATAVADAVAAQQASPFTDAEVVIVDDGSDAATKGALARIEAPIPVRVLTQDNQGRFAARCAGIDAARHELVLLVDARVSLRPDSLRFVAERMTPGEPLPVWNAHVDVQVDGNPYARFWNVLTDAAFSAYFAEPRTTSYGLDEFDRFPKGTTGFLAPRSMLLEAIDAFRSLYQDSRHANDDTILIRHIAGRQRINISPGFSCLYRGRRSLRDFLRHAAHRGVVFIDGYGRPGTRFFPVIAVFYPISATFAALGVRRPRLVVVGVGLMPLAWAAVGAKLRRPWRDVAVLAALGPGWLAAYSVGLWQGAALGLRRSLR